MKKYLDHPIADLFPILSTAEIKEIASDIQTNGQQVPIVLLEHNGEEKILDGRNRMRACERLGIDPLTITWSEVNRTLHPGITPLDWVISMNLKRRHLTDTQREAIAAEIIVYKEALEKEAELLRQNALKMESGEQSAETTATSEGEKVDAAAAQMNVKPRNVRKAVNVAKKGSKEIKAAHKAGALSTAAAERLSKLEKKTQEKLEKATAKGLAQAAKKLAQQEKADKKKSRGGLAADKAAANAGKTFKELAFQRLADLLAETEDKADAALTWREYHRKVVAALKAID